MALAMVTSPPVVLRVQGYGRSAAAGHGVVGSPSITRSDLLPDPEGGDSVAQGREPWKEWIVRPGAPRGGSAKLHLVNRQTRRTPRSTERSGPDAPGPV